MSGQLQLLPNMETNIKTRTSFHVVTPNYSMNDTIFSGYSGNIKISESLTNYYCMHNIQ